MKGNYHDNGTGLEIKPEKGPKATEEQVIAKRFIRHLSPHGKRQGVLTGWGRTTRGRTTYVAPVYGGWEQGNFGNISEEWELVLHNPGKTP